MRHGSHQGACLQYAPKGAHWQSGLPLIPDNETMRFAKAVAEWADGDSIAAHYAYGNDLFCTRDMGKTAGAASVLSLNNRRWLETQFGIEFVSPTEATRRLGLGTSK